LDGCFGGNKCFKLFVGVLFIFNEDYIAVDVIFEEIKFPDDPLDICDILEILDMLDPLS
jgi:hypothetical protein